MTGTGEHGFVLTRTFDAPRELVYKVFTDPKYVALWWGVKGSTSTVTALDVRVGGIWHIDMRSENGTVYPNGGVYIDVRENERIVYSDIADPSSPAWKHHPRGDAVHSINFSESDGKTTVTFAARFASVSDRDWMLAEGMREGLAEGFDRLEHLLKRLTTNSSPP